VFQLHRQATRNGAYQNHTRRGGETKPGTNKWNCEIGKLRNQDAEWPHFTNTSTSVMVLQRAILHPVLEGFPFHISYCPRYGSSTSPLPVAQTSHISFNLPIQTTPALSSIWYQLRLQFLQH
jgi:hypothetical protein